MQRYRIGQMRKCLSSFLNTSPVTVSFAICEGKIYLLSLEKTFFHLVENYSLVFGKMLRFFRKTSVIMDCCFHSRALGGQIQTPRQIIGSVNQNQIGFFFDDYRKVGFDKRLVFFFNILNAGGFVNGFLDIRNRH